MGPTPSNWPSGSARLGEDEMPQRKSASGDAASTSPDYMGTPEEARQALIEKARAWRALRQPRMATPAEHRKEEAREREARFQLANAAVLWLWHEEQVAEAPNSANEVSQ